MSSPRQDDPVVYTITVAHWWAGDIDVTIQGIDCEATDREAVVLALEKAIERVKQGTPLRTTNFN